MAIKEQIRNRVDLVELVSEHTALKRRGRNYTGLCPFHQEKTPSFSVNPDRQFFKCFGCGVGGDVFTFLQLRESVDFPEAIRILADRAGIDLRPSERSAEGSSSRAEIGRINSWACGFFQKQLRDSPSGESAREYVRQRGMAPELVDRFGIGLAIGNSASLLQAALSAGFDRQLVVNAGLCKTNEEKGTQYDTFRDRLIFPIRDTMRRCIGFGGRTLVDAPAKYLNTPETALFDKSKTLYGIDLARDAIVEANSAIVVEGYTDCIAAHQHGFRNTVATLGTAATDSHMSSLRRYCETVILVFDSDAAGEAAADRALAVGLKHNLTISLASIPGAKDPADYLQTIGPKGFSGLLNSAVDALVFRWNRTRERYRSDDSAAGRREAVSEFVTLVSELAEFGVLDAIQQGIVIGQLGNLLSVPAEQVRSLLGRRGGLARRSPTSAVDGRTEGGRPRDSEQVALVTVLGVLVNEPGLFDRVTDVFIPDRFADPAYRQIAECVCELAASTGEFCLAELLSSTQSVREAEILTDLATQGPATANREAVLEGARQRLLCVAEARGTRVLADELRRDEADGSPLDDGAQRDRLAQVGRRLAGQRRFAHQRAIREYDDSGGQGYESQ